MQNSKLLWLLSVSLLVLVGFPATSQAGDHPLHFVVVWAGHHDAPAKDLVDANRNSCRRYLSEAIGEYTNTVRSPGKAKFAKTTGIRLAELGDNWSDVADERVATWKKSLKSLENTVLVLECDSAAQRFRAVMRTPSGLVFRYSLNEMNIDESLAFKLADTFREHAIKHFVIIPRISGCYAKD